ncbi:endonuclease/exonuclease/phosphatase family protein [Fodinicurvata sp. EGI_FJ10296]|jgi:endonuclease/exonuclease/phosphatase (EEP) superfamily protein YafD|uniref:endonuclease/exonuclease/phosphatase family protein n=1 Tax=Fodinicurvata sp. EGI_FJ10296 TaxID=3231908 RepID=UPI003455BFB2
MKITLFALGAGLILLTALSLVRSPQWWIRAADFPRLQIAIALAAVALGFALVYDTGSLIDAAFAVALLASISYQSLRIFPYTRLAARQTMDGEAGDGSRTIRILISNVLMENRRADDLIARVRETDPDLILAVETNDWWDEQLRVLDRDYPHSVKRPQGNHYGMHLFSRLEMDPVNIRFLMEDDIPSVRAELKLRSGERIVFFGIHPRPPQMDQDTEERDAEILVVGREVRECERPAIVAGDLNDVAWSDTTRLFQRISGMLDPRRGRGMFSTFHAAYPFLRWPLDHVFHDDSFTLVRLQRLRSIGSDHYPVFIELRHQPSAEYDQEAPEPDGEDIEEAQEQIREGREA